MAGGGAEPVRGRDGGCGLSLVGILAGLLRAYLGGGVPAGRVKTTAGRCFRRMKFGILLNIRPGVTILRGTSTFAQTLGAPLPPRRLRWVNEQ